MLVFKKVYVYERNMVKKDLSLKLCSSNTGTPCGVGYNLRATAEIMLGANASR